MAQLKPLTTLPCALIETGYNSPGYQALLEAAQAGWIPAEQDENGQWVFNLADLRFISGSLMLERIVA